MNVLSLYRVSCHPSRHHPVNFRTSKSQPTRKTETKTKRKSSTPTSTMIASNAFQSFYSYRYHVLLSLPKKNQEIPFLVCSFSIGPQHHTRTFFLVLETYFFLIKIEKATQIFYLPLPIYRSISIIYFFSSPLPSFDFKFNIKKQEHDKLSEFY